MQTLTAGLRTDTARTLHESVSAQAARVGCQLPWETHTYSTLCQGTWAKQIFGREKCCPLCWLPDVGGGVGGQLEGLPGMHNELLIHCQLASPSTLQRGLLFSLVWR